MDLKKIQKDIWQNKLNKGFNTTDVNREFCLLYGEVAEAYDAWKKKKDDLNEELADIAIYLESEINLMGIDTAKEHSPGLLQRQITVENFITKYAQIYCKGYAYSDYMSIDDLEDITINHKK